MSIKRHILPFFLLPFLFSCSVTKFVPENQYLLHKVTIETDSKSVSSTDLENYVQQKPDNNRLIRKKGEPPVIFSVRSMRETEKQLAQRMQNRGYLNATVTADTILKKKKAHVIYRVQSNAPFTIRNYEVGITDTAILSVMADPRVKRDLKARPGIRYVPEELDRELQMLTSSMRNRGYYNLSKENFYFLVDTSLKFNQADVKLMLRDSWENREDSIRFNTAFNRYHIHTVTIISGYDQFDPKSRDDFGRPDTVDYRGLRIIYGSRPFIRREVLYQNCFVRPGHYYSDQLLENTVSSINSMSAVKQANIYFREVIHPDSSLLNAFVTVAPANIFHWQTGLDGTNSAGDHGIAGFVTFQNKNMFNGSETFRIRLNGGIETITASGSNLSKNFYQYGVDFSLISPRFLLSVSQKLFLQQTGMRTILRAGVNWQSRPEYNQRFVDIDWMYRWSTKGNRLNHTLDVYNVNFIVTSRMSDAFLAYLDKSGNVFLKQSYTDRFITRSGYSFVYAPSRAQNEGYTIRAGIDVAGTLPYIFSEISGAKAENGTYQLFGNPFAQYVKLSADFTRFFMPDTRNIVAFHAGLGISSPFLNSSIIPYEQRFFAGGPNSVRGWSTRTLGPGAYKPEGRNDFINQNGDIKILLNMEYRLKTKSFLEFAAFVDAGNVWTVRDYDNQQGGQFKWGSFLKEMGLSWGVGVRPNFGFILIRLDAGMKIYSPELHRATTRAKLSSNLAFHFAVGYPF